MARPIPLDVPRTDPREELQTRLQNAPAEHAQALLAAYDVLQGLHDSGTLDVVRGVLRSREKILDIGVEAAGSPQSIRTIRNLLLLTNMLGAIEPETLKTFTQAGPDTLKAMVAKPERPGLWTLIKDFFFDQDFRRGMAAVNSMLKILGKISRPPQ